VDAWLEYHHKGDITIYCLKANKEPSIQLTSKGDFIFLRGINLFDLIKSEIEEIDEIVIQQIDKLDRIRKVLAGHPTGDEGVKALYEYASLWLAFIPRQHLRGQSQRWRGWYLVPEHGPLTVEKLFELQKILKKLKTMSTGGSLLIGKSAEGVTNTVALLEAGGVKYFNKYSNQRKRDLFVRQQKNYLIRLGLVTEPFSYHIALTDRGLSWLTISTKEEIVEAYRKVLQSIRWAWCNMPFFSFLCELADRCEGKLTYREMFNWVIHAYDWKQIDEAINAIEISPIIDGS
jgi:hypothetical protein